MAEPATQSRLTGSLSWLALAAIVLGAARLRWAWPAVPLADADTWGYLNPALSELTGGHFRHTYARNFVYPGWVWVLLRAGGDFRWISLAQHLLGLATGVVLWRVWENWRTWFPAPRLPSWAATLLGLLLAAFYLCSTTVIHFEHQIRPEAIFPFFAIAAIYLTLKFLRAWSPPRRIGPGVFWAGALVFDTALLYQLKPSFGLAAGVALLPLLPVWCQRAAAGRPRLLLTAGTAAAAVLAGLLLLWPEHRLAAEDELSTLFLPETLLTVHADVIRDQIAADLAAGNPTPYTTAWLTTLHDRLDHELVLAAAPDQRPYATLGFNPDYLLYQDSFCHFLNREMSAPRLAKLGFYYFERAWLHRPGAMGRNVGRQLAAFYGPDCRAFWQGRGIDLHKNYVRTVSAFEPPNYQAKMSAYAPAVRYLAQSRLLAAAPAEYHQPDWFTVGNRLAPEIHLPLLIAFGAGFLFVLVLRNRPVRRELGPPGWLVLLFFGYTFGNCLTVALVHSLDVDRYSTNLVIFVVLAEMTTLLWCIEALLSARFRLNPELYPAAAADAPRS